MFPLQSLSRHPNLSAPMRSVNPSTTGAWIQPFLNESYHWTFLYLSQFSFKLVCCLVACSDAFRVQPGPVEGGTRKGGSPLGTGPCLPKFMWCPENFAQANAWNRIPEVSGIKSANSLVSDPPDFSSMLKINRHIHIH